MNTVLIDWNTIHNEKDFHKTLKELLEFPEYYGENLDAFWDCLITCCDLPLTIIWKDFEKSRGYLQDWTNKVIDVFKDAENEIKDLHIIYD